MGRHMASKSSGCGQTWRIIRNGRIGRATLCNGAVYIYHPPFFISSSKAFVVNFITSKFLVFWSLVHSLLFLWFMKLHS